jgi:hypothetical protein
MQHPCGISPTKLKITKTIPTAPRKLQKYIYFQPVVPVATSYPLANQIMRVGGLEIGVLEGGLGGFGYVDMDLHIF